MPFDAFRICHAAFDAHGPLFATLFVGGLVGSVTHCAGMCGPFVLSQTATLLDAKPLLQVSDLTRLRGAALLPYHAGRLTTYAALGVIMTLLAVPLRAQPWFDLFSALLLALAGFMFLFSALPRFAPHFSPPVIFSQKLAGSVASLFKDPHGIRGYLLGLALGFLPCGLVYAALFSVAARGEPLTAALGMIVFALGTVPALVAVGIGGQFAFRKFRDAGRYLFPALMVINSLALFAMAGELIK